MPCRSLRAMRHSPTPSSHAFTTFGVLLAAGAALCVGACSSNTPASADAGAASRMTEPQPGAVDAAAERLRQALQQQRDGAAGPGSAAGVFPPPRRNQPRESPGTRAVGAATTGDSRAESGAGDAAGASLPA